MYALARASSASAASPNIATSLGQCFAAGPEHDMAVVGQQTLAYTLPVVSPSRQQFDAEAVRRKERQERAARVAAMFERWATEDLSSEPEWDADRIPGLAFRSVETADSKSEQPQKRQ